MSFRTDDERALLTDFLRWLIANNPRTWTVDHPDKSVGEYLKVRGEDRSWEKRNTDK